MANPFLRPDKVQNEHLYDFLCGAHRCTWFAVKGSPSLALTRTGTRPGGSAADLVINLVFRPLLGDLRDELRARELTCAIPRASEPFFSKDCNSAGAFAAEAAFVDDLAAPALCDNNEHVETHVILLAEAVYLVTAKYGVAFNFGPSKTAVLVSPRGEGRKSTMGRLFVVNEAKIWPPLAKVNVPLTQYLQVPRGHRSRGRPHGPRSCLSAQFPEAGHRPASMNGVQTMAPPDQGLI